MGTTDRIISINGTEIDLSNTDKEFFPTADISKGEVIEYYTKIWKYACRYAADRPMVLQRFPDGIQDSGFYQKQTPDYFPEWIATIQVENKEDASNSNLVNCNKQETLVYLANQGALTMHVWLSKKHNLNTPDRLAFDFDPSDDDFSKVQRAATILQSIISKKGISSFVMTTGSEGLHVTVPLKPEKEFEPIREIARNIAQQVVNEDPESFTLETAKKNRGNKVFVDYLRNAYAQTTVMPFSIRARQGAPVAVPLSWDEVGRSSLDPQKYTVTNIFRRLSQKKDPWKDYMHNAISFEKLQELVV